MCVSALIAGASLLASGVGMMSQMASAEATYQNQKYLADIRTKELTEQTELAKISALQKENERARVFARDFSASLAAIGASGMAEHISFFQGIAPDSEQQFLADSRALRLNLATEQLGLQREIGVTAYGVDIARHNRNMSNVGAIAGFVQDAMGAASMYAKTATPKGK